MKALRNKVLNNFGENVRAYRLKLKISQEELGFRSGLDRTYISGIERGTRNISLTAIVSVAKGLGISSNELLKGVD